MATPNADPKLLNQNDNKPHRVAPVPGRPILPIDPPGGVIPELNVDDLEPVEQQEPVRSVPLYEPDFPSLDGN